MSSFFNPSVPESLQKSLDGSKVEYVQLGKSGLRISMPLIGIMGLGSDGMAPWAVKEEESLQILKDAWDRGKPISPALVLVADMWKVSRRGTQPMRIPTGVARS